jgi:hypothetical protein
MRSTFTLMNKIVVSSDFDSGNLSYCEAVLNSDTEESKCEESSIFEAVQDAVFKFNIWISNDGLPYI